MDLDNEPDCEELGLLMDSYLDETVALENQTIVNNFKLKWQKWSEEDDNYKAQGKRKCPLFNV